MTDREQLCAGLSQAVWGYFLLHFNFNLNFDAASINILPNFVGALLLLSAVGKLSAERRDLLLLRPLCVLLAVWHGADWVLAVLGSGLEERGVSFLGMLVTAAALYFHFQFLTDMAALAEKYQPEGETLDLRFRRRRTVLLVLTTAANLLSSMAQLLRSERQAVVLAGAVVCLVVVLLVLVVMIMVSLFQLRRYAGESGGMTAEPPQ